MTHRPMSRTPFDNLSKDLALALLAPLGRVESDLRIVAEAQYADLFLELLSAEVPRTGPRAFVARLVERYTLLEFAQRPPGLVTMTTWTRKRDAQWNTLRVEAKRDGRPRPRRPPLLLVLSAGDPKTLRAEYPLHPMPGIAGCFQGAPANTVLLVVLSKLGRTRGTLLLRCMGRGATLLQALRELSALPPDAPERVLAARWIARFHLQRQTHPTSIDPEVAMQFQQIYEAMMQQQLDKGIEKGIEKGREQGIAQGIEKGIAPLVRLCVRRLGRALTPGEEVALAARLERVGPDRLADVVLDSAPAELAAWLADPDAR